MKVLCHHIYEYKKGLRNLVLHTMPTGLRDVAEAQLKKYDISYIIRAVGKTKINIFFGAGDCVKIIDSFGDKSLSEYTPEEDFILGIMLGYCRLAQCGRYLKRKASVGSGVFFYPNVSLI